MNSTLTIYISGEFNLYFPSDYNDSIPTVPEYTVTSHLKLGYAYKVIDRPYAKTILRVKRTSGMLPLQGKKSKAKIKMIAIPSDTRYFQFDISQNCQSGYDCMPFG